MYFIKLDINIIKYVELYQSRRTLSSSVAIAIGFAIAIEQRFMAFSIAIPIANEPAGAGRECRVYVV